jgi:putative zinc finger/helix-turn-helix YgiT family protein
MEDQIMSKKCRNCGKDEMTARAETYLYAESGLPNVVLVGVEVRRCPSCGHHELVLPRVTELHRTIAHAVIHKPTRLSGAEVRYLRKYLGWSGADFAGHVGVDPSTVSNWETDKDPIGTSSDRLLRLMVVHGAPVQEYSLDELVKIEDKRTPPIEVRVAPKGHGWERLQAAA